MIIDGITQTSADINNKTIKKQLNQITNPFN